MRCAEDADKSILSEDRGNNDGSKPVGDISTGVSDHHCGNYCPKQQHLQPLYQSQVVESDCENRLSEGVRVLQGENESDEIAINVESSPKPCSESEDSTNPHSSLFSSDRQESDFSQSQSLSISYPSSKSQSISRSESESEPESEYLSL